MLAKETIYCFFSCLELVHYPKFWPYWSIFELHMMEPYLLLLRRTSFSFIPFHEAYENKSINNHILGHKSLFAYIIAAALY